MSENPHRIAVLGGGLWVPGFPSLAAWRGGQREAEDSKPIGQSLGRINKRRAGVLGRSLSDATHEALTASGLDPAEVPVVVGSAMGEAQKMIGILDDMWRKKSEVSPAAFAASVHNAASGLMSIGYKNRGFATSIAADFDTPAAALLEAIGLIAIHGTPVVVSCADESIPESFLADTQPWCLLAASIALAPPDHPDAVAHLQVGTAAGHDPVPQVVLPEDFTRNPMVGLLDLVLAVDAGASGSVALDRGRGRGYVAEITRGES